jgi:hypothetical protein
VLIIVSPGTALPTMVIDRQDFSGLIVALRSSSPASRHRFLNQLPKALTEWGWPNAVTK